MVVPVLRRTSLVVSLCVSALVFAGLSLSPAAASQDSYSKWSSGGTGWKGTGVAFLPGGKQVGQSPDSDDCPGCTWELVVVCSVEGERSCAVSYGCAPGRPFVLIVIDDPGLGRITVGAQCMNSDPITAEQMGAMVTERVRQAAPVARPRFQPNESALTALPTNFRSGQPSSVSRSESIAGMSVDFEARAGWRWTWGDGTAPLSTNEPGGSWPKMTVTHTFRKPGSARVTLRTSWTAEYWVNGAGPFAVGGGPIEQSASLTVPVKEARSVLIGAGIG